MAKIGVIGGSGLYDIKDLEAVRCVRIETPFGAPSDEYTIGTLDGIEVAFLPRHGKKHTILPTELNYRANIYGMKKLGVERIVSISAVGSFKTELKPRDILVVNQFIDRTNQARMMTFFGEGVAAHVSFAKPVCGELSDILYEAGRMSGAAMHSHGTYLNMEGPAFSTMAESQLYKSWGADVIGMTNMPEARLAREAEICYASLAMITDYDCWHMGEGCDSEVNMKIIIDNLNKNAQTARDIIKKAIKMIPEERSCECKDALKHALVTRPESISEKRKKELDIIMGRYFEREI